MSTIHLISEGFGAELIDRALRSIFTVYGCPTAAHQFDRLETWQLNGFIADTQFPVISGMNIGKIREFLARYAANTKSKIYIWYLLPPIVRLCDRTISEVEALAQKYPQVKRIYLQSQEFNNVFWEDLRARLSLETLQKLTQPDAYDVIPALDLTALEYTSKFGEITSSMIFSRLGSVDDYKIFVLFETIFQHLPPYLLI
ncbi:hypothetical protein [Chamaesiphon sp.]|uniref:hypothetical protein n=1 Tax=Chamaesiphon sp. TaxID=2814140 RepID=UPI0035933D2D